MVVTAKIDLKQAPQSGYALQLRSVLYQYLSKITVDGVLRRIYREEKIDPDTMSKHDLERIYQSSLFLTVRLFCAPEELSNAMLDLADLLE